MVKQHRVTLCGVDCAIEEYGDPAGKPVVLMHGWLDNCGSFEPMKPYLSDYRVLALDSPGHGHSAHLPSGMAYHFLDLVYVIQDLAAHFELDNFYLVGHSMGGAAATLYASVESRVSKLVLIEALGPLTTNAERTLKLMQESIGDRRALAGKQLPVYDKVDEALKIRAAVSKMPEELIRPIVERGLMPYKNGFSWRSDPRLRVTSINRLTEAQLTTLLPAIECPTLLIEAEEGLFTNNEVIQARKEHFSTLETQLLPGGHHVHMEAPQRTAELIKAFFNQ